MYAISNRSQPIDKKRCCRVWVRRLRSLIAIENCVHTQGHLLESGSRLSRKIGAKLTILVLNSPFRVWHAIGCRNSALLPGFLNHSLRGPLRTEHRTKAKAENRAELPRRPHDYRQSKTGIPSFLALSARLPVMPSPRRRRRRRGGFRASDRSRLNGAALPSLAQSGLKAICETLRLAIRS